MKKSLVVLLIAVLALSAVFAADVAITATGEVAASYTYDFDKKSAVYSTPSLDGELEWTVNFPLAKAGTSYPYINVAGEIEVDLTGAYINLTPEVEFTAFEIVGEDWKVNFLDSIGSLDYAVSAIDTAAYQPYYTYFNTEFAGLADGGEAIITANKEAMDAAQKAYEADKADEYKAALEKVEATSPWEKHVTGKYTASALTYKWLTNAEYTDAVSIEKDGIGKLTVAANVMNSDFSKDYGTPVYMTGAELKEAVYYAETNQTGVTYKPVNTDGPGKAYDLNNIEYLADDAVYLVRKNTKNAADESKTFAVEAESVELKLADSVSTQFGFGFASMKGYAGSSEYKNGNIFGFSTKSSYEDILTVATDLSYNFGTKGVFNIDVATKFAYEMVTFDAYFSNAAKYYYADPCAKYGVSTSAKATEGYLLSAKSVVDVEEIGTKFTFTGKDLLGHVDVDYTDETSERISAAKLSAKIENTYFDNYTFTFSYGSQALVPTSVGFKAVADYSAEVGVTAYAGVSAESAKSTVADAIEDDVAYASLKNYTKYTYTGFTVPVFTAGIAYAKDGLSLSVDFSSQAEDYVASPATALGSCAFSVKAGYEAEKFTINSGLFYNSYEYVGTYGDWSMLSGLYYGAGIESDKLVDGATLSLEYASGELLDSVADFQYGTLTAACTVEF